MRNLFNFIKKYSAWFVFTFYVVVSCVLLFRNNPYQQSVYLTSANVVTGSVNSLVSGVTGYFNLKEVNEDLMENNARLENEVLNLRAQLKEMQSLGDDSVRYEGMPRFGYINATVIGNSTRHPCNYFTINRGSADGVQPGMGVVDHNGVVGIVNVTSPHTARVISVLNTTQHFSVKLKGTKFIGSLAWHGRDPQTVYMEDVPRHVKYQIGDTVVTSGFSSTFPDGIAIGTVQGQVKSNDNNYFTLKVRLLSDIPLLNAVRVIKDSQKAVTDSLAAFDAKPEEK